MANIVELNVVVTSVDIGTPTALDTTPLMGGLGRNGVMRIPVLPLTGVFSIEGATHDEDGAEPAEGSALWTEIAEITSASDQIQEITLPNYIRWNTTTDDGDGPNVKVYIEAAP